MASDAKLPDSLPDYPEAGESGLDAALQQGHWRTWRGLSRGLDRIERFLAASGFDRAPWLAVAFGSGVSAWFFLDNKWQWLGLLCCCIALVAGTLASMRSDGRYPYLRQSLIWLPMLVAAGSIVVWSKSALVGATPIDRPVVAQFDAVILEREARPAEQRVRLVLAARNIGGEATAKVRVNLPQEDDRPELAAGAVISLKARLMPPAPPMLPGGYNFARTAWFEGLAATGSVIGPVTINAPSTSGGWLAGIQARLSEHVRERLPGSSGAIAAALASGDRGGIAEDDAQAMRDAGLAHLLSISGLHVSAVIAAAYFLALKLLALWPALALRVRLPLVAAGAGALAGIAYTLLTGAQVPTVRSCLGALLVLVAIAIGREALSLRILAVAAFFVLLAWPESIVGPSFQMSFAAVMTIIALGSSEASRRLLAPREEGMLSRGIRYVVALFATGLAIEIALMPIGLYHFHRAGAYGAFANVIAIPLTTIVSMPLIAIALFLDAAGLGAPAWWAAGKSIDFMLQMAHWVSSRPGAVTVLPAMGRGSFALFVAGGLWLALWTSRMRLLGLVPAAAGALSLVLLQPPDILVSGDGRHVALPQGDGRVIVLRETQSDYVRDNLTELSGSNGNLVPLREWDRARCNRDFCFAEIVRDGTSWTLLLSLGRDRVAERALAAACDRSDIVIADRWLPRSCRPRWLKADRRMLSRTGGIAIDLSTRSVDSVAAREGHHGWWRGRDD
ncbi:ComEC/Rec2 family competence protein [Novosphingobium marinum]|uniref:Competence protein ComEC n=1 Tax=Novosphingobium marinum TaxID=1514948 RepID=A0A7Y9XVU5_9SPHN|nr:ComEC/Rec2 family competence protein [Novosphingobium marinum]NYH94305.1 competence protein ComEC [Novosphingobium marinum]